MSVILFVDIISQSLVQKIHKKINNLNSLVYKIVLNWHKIQKNLVLLSENAHAQKLPQENH